MSSSKLKHSQCIQACHIYYNIILAYTVTESGSLNGSISLFIIEVNVCDTIL